MTSSQKDPPSHPRKVHLQVVVVLRAAGFIVYKLLQCEKAGSPGI